MAISFSSQKVHDLRSVLLHDSPTAILAPSSPVPISRGSYVEFPDAHGATKRIFVEAIDDQTLLAGRLMHEACELGVSSDPSELLQSAEFCMIDACAVTRVITVAHPLECTAGTDYFFERFFNHETKTVHPLVDSPARCRLMWNAKPGTKLSTNYSWNLAQISQEIKQFLTKR
jgi:hypothetical protein